MKCALMWRTMSIGLARLPVELRITHHQAGRNLDARPTVAQDVDRQQRAASDCVVLDAKVVVDPRQRGFDGRSGRLWRLRIRTLAKRAVFINREHHPSIR